MQKHSKIIKIIIPIQSISDIITNSSSEIFAYIYSKKNLKLIYAIIDHIFGYNQEYEMTPCVDLKNKSDYDYSDEYIQFFPEEWIEIELPYNMNDCKEFYRKGLEAILDEKIGHNNYIIKYNED